jgi:hypothetical protein
LLSQLHSVLALLAPSKLGPIIGPKRGLKINPKSAQNRLHNQPKIGTKSSQNLHQIIPKPAQNMASHSTLFLSHFPTPYYSTQCGFLHTYDHQHFSYRAFRSRVLYIYEFDEGWAAELPSSHWCPNDMLARPGISYADYAQTGQVSRYCYNLHIQSSL